VWPSLSTIRREVAGMVSLDEGTLFLKKQGRVLEEEQELRASRFYYALVRQCAVQHMRASMNLATTLGYVLVMVVLADTGGPCVRDAGD